MSNIETTGSSTKEESAEVVSVSPVPSSSQNHGGNKSNNPNAHFPWRLHELLTDCETNGNDTIISWIPGTNNAFKVHDKQRFTKEILPEYFNATKYKSFQRNLNLWDFESIIDGPNKGGSSHPLFIRGDREKCHFMTRQKVKGGKSAKQEPQIKEESTIPGIGELSQLPVLAGLAAISNNARAAVNNGLSTELQRLSFCAKLHLILARPEQQGCLRWTADGRCIALIDPIQFQSGIFRNFFPNTAFLSFLGEFKRYGFQRVSHLGYEVCYYHDLMIQGCQHLCKYISTPEESLRFVSNDGDIQKDLGIRDQNLYPSIPNTVQSLLLEPQTRPLLQLPLQQGGLDAMLRHAITRDSSSSSSRSGFGMTSHSGTATLPYSLSTATYQAQNQAAISNFLEEVKNARKNSFQGDGNDTKR